MIDMYFLFKINNKFAKCKQNRHLKKKFAPQNGDYFAWPPVSNQIQVRQ